MTQPVLTVSVVCHDNPQFLDACLESIRDDSAAPALRLVVTDNTSSPAVQSVARRHMNGADLLIVNPRPKGFAANHNAALRRTTTPFVLLLNDDTLVLPHALGEMMRCMETDPTLGAVGCKQFATPDLARLQHTCLKHFPSAWSALRDGLLSYTGIRRVFPGSRLVRAWSSLVAEHDLSQPVAHLNGACLLLRSAALDQVGVMDERFFMFLEETDLCLRLWRRGWRVWHTAEAAIVHYGHGSTTRPFREQQFGQSTAAFLQKHYGWTGVVEYRLVEALLTPLRLFHSCAGTLLHRRTAALSPAGKHA
jgi:GT2 family glycosyltransferase